MISVLVGAFSCGAGIRVHRIDKLGESSATSPAFDHTAARAEATKVFPLLADKHGWDFSQSSDSEIFTNEGLRDIDVIIFDNNTGNLLNASEQRAFEKWVRAGGGVIGIHGATHAHKGVNEANVGEWPFWYGLWGVLHKTGPKDGPNGRRGYADEIVMHQAKDGIIGNLPSRWIFDKVEWYFWNYHDGFDDKHVVATAEVQANQPELPAHYPVTWCGQYKGGRVWYTNMGHYAENFHQPEFIQHIVDGINWVARGQVD
ncbi:MAG: hypothetical protein SynsKO_19780 [Synoicihabitans sp.]